MRIILLLLLGLSNFYTFLNAQVRGKITDQTGEPLPFASIYLKGTSTGTNSNVDGAYNLDIPPGSYELVFQYVGYQQHIEKITLTDEPLQLDVKLKEEAIDLTEVVVRADAEDPAYAVIRKAIAKRKYYRDLVSEYSCDVYIKGNMKFLDAPEKFMGQEIGTMRGSLDSNRQGIIYLSESKAKLYFQEPDNYKEEMIFTKLSGNDQGFGFNRASDMDFNLYKAYSLLGRQIISPIASNALQYYRYKLVGTFYDDKQRLVNKIQLLPKRAEDPVYHGFIYITEELWNIQSADLMLTAGAMKQPGLDSLYIKQVHVPVKEPDTWRIFSQTIRFRAGLFGFKLGGDFTAIYSDYDIAPQFEKGFFDNEVFKVTEGANDKDLVFWDSIRPIPLTQEEEIDYVRKDSLQEVRKSKVYLDSVDQKNNQFKPLNLLFGYSYNNSYERKYFRMGSPLTTVQFNTVQGFNADLILNYRKEYDDYNMRWFEFQPQVSYGFSDQRIRSRAAFTYNFNRTNYAQLKIEGGIDAFQFNEAQPISKTLNTLTTLLYKDNFLKLYDKAFGKISYRRELFNGVLLRSSIEYAERSPLVNNSAYSFRKDEGKAFLSNDPLQPESFEPSFEKNKALIVSASLRLRYKQRYLTYPNRKYIQGSKLPDLILQYQKGIASGFSDVNFDKVAVQVVERYLPVGVLGYLEFNLEGGTFLNDRAIYFMDYQHFNGNQPKVGNPFNYMSSFKRLPYYAYSTKDQYFEGHFQHHFEGYLLDKLPGLRKLGWYSVLGAAVLYTPEQKWYSELSFGLDNIGFGALRLFRIDAVLSHEYQKDWQLSWQLGIKLPTSN